MNKHSSVLATVAIATVAVASAASLLAPLAASAQSPDEAQVKALEARLAKAFQAKDVDGVMKAYAPDVFVFDVITPRQYVGAAAYRKDWEGFLATFHGPIKVEVADLVIKTVGPIAYGHSIQRVAGMRNDGTKADMAVRVTDVYRKAGGQWLIVQEHVSVPIDPKSMKPDMMSRP
jgi:uncharacterized protein (TIGR02246 family)